jgi:hypothetical protein
MSSSSLFGSLSRRIASSVLALSLLAAPVTAFAGEKNADGNKAKVHQEKKGPMTAEKFNEVVEKRIAKVTERVDHRLAKAKIDDAKRAEVKKDLENGVKEIREAAKKAEADGVVTREEAKDVHAAARRMHEAIQKDLPGHKHGKHEKNDKK